jgi:hypothetical protein
MHFLDKWNHHDNWNFSYCCIFISHLLIQQAFIYIKSSVLQFRKVQNASQFLLLIIVKRTSHVGWHQAQQTANAALHLEYGN